MAEQQTTADNDLAVAVLLRHLVDGDAAQRPQLMAQLAHAYGIYGRFAESRKILEHLYRMQPQDPGICRSLGLAACRAGDWRRGLELYDSGRWKLSEFETVFRAFPQPPWCGEAIGGKRLLLWAEQGIGDQVMQARVLGDLQARGAQITLEADPRIFPLLAHKFPAITCYPQTTQPSPDLLGGSFDFQCSLLSAWRWSEPCLAAEPHGAYLEPDRALSERFRGAWARNGWSINVGLAWQSGARKIGPDKSIDIDLLAPLLAHTDVTFHCLQYGVSQDDVAAINRRLGRSIKFDGMGDARNDINRLSAQIAALDLVVSIDNATVHLAGAVGTPCWVLLPCRADWRWGEDGAGTRLYADMRLFRSRHMGRWGQVVMDLVPAFTTWVTRRSQPGSLA